MPAPVVASYTTGGVTDPGNTSFPLAVPGGTASGDLLVMLLESSNGPAKFPASPPTGFVLLTGADATVANVSARAYFRVADGTESAWTVTGAGGYGNFGGTCLRITGAQASFIGAGANGVPGWSTVTSPNVTTTAADSLLLWFGVAASGYTAARPTSATAIVDTPGISGNLSTSTSSTTQATAGLVTGLAEPLSCDTWAALTIAVAPAGVAGFTGSGAVTLGPTVTATGHAAYTGAGNVALGPTVTATGHAAYTGAGTVTLGPTVAATGQAAYAGSGTVTLGPTVAATGHAAYAGAGNVPLGPTVSASGGAAYVGLAVANLGPTVIATGAVVGSFSGSGTVTLGPTVAATGHAAYAGAGNVPLGPTVSASGGAAYVGFAVAMLGPTVSATGAVVGSFSGSGSVVLGPTVSATGLAAYAGSGTVALGPTVAATGSTAGVFSGSGAVVLGPTVAATGTAAYVGSGSVNIGPTVRATGSAGSTAAASAGSLVLFGLGGGPLVLFGLGGNVAVAPPPPAAAKMIRRAVLATLKADATLAALVGANVFPSVIPESSLMPAVVYQFGKIARQHDLDGPTGVAFASVTVFAVSKVATECESVAEAVRQIFDGFTGFLATASGRVRILETDSGDEGDVWEPPADATGRGVFEIAIPYTFMYLEPLPARMT